MGAAIDTQIFFDAVPHALAVKHLMDVGVPPIVVHAWGAFITRIRRYISIQNSVGSMPTYCDRGIRQRDPISMFAAAAALGLWLDSRYQIPTAPSSEAWVMIDFLCLGLSLTGVGLNMPLCIPNNGTLHGGSFPVLKLCVLVLGSILLLFNGLMAL